MAATAQCEAQHWPGGRGDDGGGVLHCSMEGGSKVRAELSGHTTLGAG